MSDRATVEPLAVSPSRSTEMSINNLTFLLGVGAIVAAVVGGSCSTNARIGDLHAEIRDVRAEIRDVRAEVRGEIDGVRVRVGALEDSTAASFATVHQQLGAVAVCILEIRNLVGGDNAGRGPASTACDSALRAILAPSAPTGPCGQYAVL